MVSRRGLVTAAAVLVTAACVESPTVVGSDRVEPVARPSTVQGIYVNAQAAGSPTRFPGLLNLADGSTLNTFVVDVKERGEVSYASQVPLVGEVGAGRSFIADLPGLLPDRRQTSEFLAIRRWLSQ